MSSKKALIIGYDVIGPLMAGPGLRSLRLAEAASANMPVDILIGPESAAIDASPAGFVGPPLAGAEAEFVAGYSACLAASTFPLTHPWLLETDIPLAVDCYCPYILENLYMYSAKPPDEARFQHERHLKAQIEALLRADLVLCASSRQRDLFTGALMALNRLNVDIVKNSGDPGLIRVVPFGIEESDPPAEGGFRGKAPGYGEDDEVLIWAGGIWEWFNPLDLIRAVDLLRANHPAIRLHFLGVKHPNRHIPFPKKASEAIKLTEELNLKERHVFFGDWVPASARGGYLRDADLGVSFHRVGFETRFSFRTRLMDYLWAELPMVVSAGDDLGEEFVSKGLGEALSETEPDAIAAAIERWLAIRRESDDLPRKFRAIKEDYRWSRVAAPLVEFLLEPRSTAGMRGEGFFETHLGAPKPAAGPSGVKRAIRRVIRKDD